LEAVSTEQASIWEFRRTPIPIIAAGLAFLLLFWEPIATLGRDWWSDPEAGHGLLLGPLAVFLAWRRGRAPEARPQPFLGIAVLVAAVLLRYLSGLAAELSTMRLSLLLGAAGIVVFVAGFRQLLHWWLPSALLLLSVPIPTVVLNTIAFPLQLKASQMGATLLEWRNVPVRLQGNVIQLPGQSLFVTEACSGLRSLTALFALAVLIGGLWLRRVWARIALLAVTIPVAMALNGVRVFLTGFFVFYVDPALGEGVMHYTEGWFMFMIAFAALGGVGWGLSRLERIGRSPA
jgi:exosortase